MSTHEISINTLYFFVWSVLRVNKQNIPPNGGPSKLAIPCTSNNNPYALVKRSNVINSTKMMQVSE